MGSEGCINHCNERNEKVPKKFGDIFSHVTMGTNVTKGALMIRPHLSVQHYVTRESWILESVEITVTKRNEKVPKKLGTSFPT